MSDELLQAMWDAFTKTGDNDFESMRAVLDVLHANGYRRCAEGQRVTQWCDRAEEAEAEVEWLRKDYHHACATVAQLYAAATGRHGEGPLRGVIEDAAAVCSERDALRAEVERLRKGIAEALSVLKSGNEFYAESLLRALDAARGES